MEKYIIKTNRCKSAIPFLLSKNWDRLNGYMRDVNVDDFSIVDSYGFSALPGGKGNVWGSYREIGEGSEWWLQDKGYFILNDHYFSGWDHSRIVTRSSGENETCYIRLIKDK
jgi:hypothetical protein